MQDTTIRNGALFTRINAGNYDVRQANGDNFVDDCGDEYWIHVRDLGDGSWGTTLIYNDDNIPEDLPDYVQAAQEIEAEYQRAEEALLSLREPDVFYAVWQRGVAVYGVGISPDEATEDAREWVSDFETMKRELDEGNDSNVTGKMEIIKISLAAKQKIDKMGGDVGLEEDEAGIYRIEDENDETEA